MQMRPVIESDCQENLTKCVICNQINNCFINARIPMIPAAIE